MPVDIPIDIDTTAVRKPEPLPRCTWGFPDPAMLSGDLAGMGADFEPQTIVEACAHGIFPWPDEDEDLLWFSPDPRAIIPVDGFHVSTRLARTLRQARFTASIDRAFEAVLEGCANRVEGTWITPAYREAYLRLHELGWAHSFEAWAEDGTLAGGVYGIACAGVFQAESMFFAVRDGSKAALFAMMQHLGDRGFGLVDVQVLNPHVASLGGIDIPRVEYLARLREALLIPATV